MLGFLGGTGPEGRGLALRFAMAGEHVLIGSRDPERAKAAADSVLQAAPGGTVRGLANADVAREADIVFVVVPYAAQRDTLEALKGLLAGKTIVDAVVPLVFNKGRAAAVPVAEGSAAQQAQAVLPNSTVVAAFHTVSAQELLDPRATMDTDVIVCASDATAKATVMKLAEKIQGVRAVDGGALENARYVEEFTALLLNINRIYKAHASIKIVGI